MRVNWREPWPLDAHGFEIESFCANLRRHGRPPKDGHPRENTGSDELRLLNPRHRVAVHEVERQVLEAAVTAEVYHGGARGRVLPVVVDDDAADLCTNQPVSQAWRDNLILCTAADRDLVVEVRQRVDRRPVHVAVHSQQSDLLRR